MSMARANLRPRSSAALHLVMLIGLGLAGAMGGCATAARRDHIELIPDPPVGCANCAEWNRPQTPFRIFGNTYYVGPAGLSSILVASDEGLILLDAALPQSAALIAENIAHLGFDLADLRLIVTSHTHHDHVGGVAALARATSARVLASAPSAEALRAGRPNADDPQYTERDNRFPPVSKVRVVADRETIRIGNVVLTAHLTAGHTPGSTTWTWQSCEGPRCVNVVYADTLTSVSAEGFRFTDTPGRVEEFRASIDRLAALPCDVLLSPHPGLIRMEAKLEAWRAGPKENPFIGTGACAAYASGVRNRLEERVASEARR
jgi:metallo-beta-lactamase class B